MNQLWPMTLDIYLEIVELAKAHGKGVGDNMAEEMSEIMTKHNIKPMGETEQDIDLIAGNLREEGVKVLNLKEVRNGS